MQNRSFHIYGGLWRESRTAAIGLSSQCCSAGSEAGRITERVIVDRPPSQLLVELRHRTTVGAGARVHRMLDTASTVGGMTARAQRIGNGQPEFAPTPGSVTHRTQQGPRPWCPIQPRRSAVKADRGSRSALGKSHPAAIPHLNRSPQHALAQPGAPSPSNRRESGAADEDRSARQGDLSGRLLAAIANAPQFGRAGIYQQYLSTGVRISP